jgi:sec-independent protein translocase protein TatA
MNFFGIGLPELAVIAAIGLLVFGPRRLPELGKTLGRTLRGFQSASQEFEKEFRSALGEEDGSGGETVPAADAASGARRADVAIAPAEPEGAAEPPGS